MCAPVAPGPSAPGSVQKNRNWIGVEQSTASRQGLSQGLPNEACSSPWARHALTGCSPLLLPCLFIHRPEMDRPDGNQTTQTETIAKESRIYRWVPLHACAHTHTHVNGGRAQCAFDILGLTFSHIILMSCYKYLFCCCDHCQESSCMKWRTLGHESVIWGIVAVFCMSKNLFSFRIYETLVVVGFS